MSKGYLRSVRSHHSERHPELVSGSPPIISNFLFLRGQSVFEEILKQVHDDAPNEVPKPLSHIKLDTTPIDSKIYI